ncbi:hypothetical protein [Prauserella flavalba]|uniref:hypothetical protein n=1 Tax=Prauserella flavalba TaxID=1477506 RepID=UPI0036E78413
MDDDYRLIKLISLVGWAHPAENKCGLRYSTDADESRLSETERTAGHMMCAHYSGAVEYHQGNTDVEQTMDRRQLPDFTLEFVSNLTDDAIVALGEMVKLSLGVGDKADPAVLGKHWIDDVTTTCWRLKLADYEDRFGRTE